MTTHDKLLLFSSTKLILSFREWLFVKGKNILFSVKGLNKNYSSSAPREEGKSILRILGPS